jgi:DNA-binding beta-propeller fold protein YncE
LLPGGSISLFGLTLDAQANIYVASFGNGKVLKISPEGKIVAVFPSEAGWTPTGVTVAGTDIYVLEGQSEFLPNETKGPRVRKISANGKAITLATVGERAADTAVGNGAAKTMTSGWVKWGIAMLMLVAVVVSAWRVWRLIHPVDQRKGIV